MTKMIGYSREHLWKLQFTSHLSWVTSLMKEHSELKMLPCFSKYKNCYNCSNCTRHISVVSSQLKGERYFVRAIFSCKHYFIHTCILLTCIGINCMVHFHFLLKRNIEKRFFELEILTVQPTLSQWVAVWMPCQGQGHCKEEKSRWQLRLFSPH